MERKKKYIEIRKGAREAANRDSGRVFSIYDEKDSNGCHLLHNGKYLKYPNIEIEFEIF